MPPRAFPCRTFRWKEVIHTARMLENLRLEETLLFLQESRRVLVKNGIIRVVIDDMKKLAEGYLSDGDVEAFLRRIDYAKHKKKTLMDKLKFMLDYERGRQWHFDGTSMVRLLSDAGFSNARIMPAGTTMIPDSSDLDLFERSRDSEYIEALKS